MKKIKTKEKHLNTDDAVEYNRKAKINNEIEAAQCCEHGKKIGDTCVDCGGLCLAGCHCKSGALQPNCPAHFPNQTPDDRFDEKAKKVVSKGGFLADIDDDYEAVDFDTDAIKHFLHSEIDLARAEMVEPGAVIRAIDEARNEALEQAAKIVEETITQYEGTNDPSAALTEAADIIRKLKSK